MGRPKKATVPNSQRRRLFYQVGKILQKTVMNNGKTMYKIRWKGYTNLYDTWEPIQHLENVRQMVQQFQMKDNKLKQKITANKKSCRQNLDKIPNPGITSIKQSMVKQNKILNQQLASKQKILQKQQKQQKLNKRQLKQFYKVQKIVDKQKRQHGKIQYYRIRWRGYSPSNDTWQPLQNLKSIENLVMKFNHSLKKTKQIHKNRDNHQKEYEIQKILQKRVINQKQQYKVRCKDFKSSKYKWITKKMMKNAEKLIQQFNKTNIIPKNNQPITTIQKNEQNLQIASLLNYCKNIDNGVGQAIMQSEAVQQQIYSLFYMQNQDKEIENIIPLNLLQKQLMQRHFM